MPCLCCDKKVYIDTVEWRKMEMPICLCQRCATTVPEAVVRVLFILRSQVVTLGNDMILAKKNIERLFTAQKQLEQDFLEES
jgi:NAD-dependent SIR2 family protein deacetylase